MTLRLAISIPQPCHQPWAAMSPTPDGRHCAACATEVVDFTTLSDAEILAYLAQRGGRPVCASAYATQLVPAPVGRWRRWLLGALALLGWQPLSSCTAHPPQQPPTATASASDPAAARQPITIRGQVFDGVDGPAVPGARIIINQTQYGTVADDQGRFELVLAPTWEPIQSGSFSLVVSGNPFELSPQNVIVNTRTAVQPIELKINLKSIDGRGKVMGKIRMPEPPVAPPLK